MKHEYRRCVKINLKVMIYRHTTGIMVKKEIIILVQNIDVSSCCLVFSPA